jgi:hypothetical protein
LSQNQFTVYATVSAADNSGLYAYGVQLKPAAGSGLSIVHRTVNATLEVDESDPDYDGEFYPTKYIGFGADRVADAAGGRAGGAQDLSNGTDLVRLYGFGQAPGNLNSYLPNINPNLAYRIATTESGTDRSWGVPCQNDVFPLATGTVRLMTGSWTGSSAPAGWPTIDQSSSNTFAHVWKLNTGNDETETAEVRFAIRDFAAHFDFFALATLGNIPGGTSNIAVGGAISVSGGNRSYVSEVDGLTGEIVRGYAPIEGIGDETGNIYVMAKLVGTAADIAALLSLLNSDVGAEDSQFAPLHAAYDGQFGDGGFNALFKFQNIVGSKVFSFDSGVSPVVWDRLAVVPEPGWRSGMGILGLLLMMRRKRFGVAAFRTSVLV